MSTFSFLNAWFRKLLSLFVSAKLWMGFLPIIILSYLVFFIVETRIDMMLEIAKQNIPTIQLQAYITLNDSINPLISTFASTLSGIVGAVILCRGVFKTSGIFGLKNNEKGKIK